MIVDRYFCMKGDRTKCVFFNCPGIGTPDLSIVRWASCWNTTIFISLVLIYFKILLTFLWIFVPGPGITPETVPEDVRSLVLVVNGRTEEKVKEARLWLDHLQAQNAPPTTILVMLGNEVRGYSCKYLMGKAVLARKQGTWLQQSGIWSLKCEGIKSSLTLAQIWLNDYQVLIGDKLIGLEIFEQGL